MTPAQIRAAIPRAVPVMDAFKATFNASFKCIEGDGFKVGSERAIEHGPETQEQISRRIFDALTKRK